MTVEEFQVAQLYGVIKASREQTDGSSAVEILVNEPYQDPIMGSGQYTHKIYHIAGKAPGIIRALAPASALKVEERAWNAYPYCKTVITNPFLGERFNLTIESMHLPDRGATENALKLSPDQLALRQITYLDIGNHKLDAADAKKLDTDPSDYVSIKANRGPFSGDWQATSNPIMCCYKLVTIKCQIFGLQGRLEKFIEQTEHNLFLDFFKKVVINMDGWFGLTMADIRELEEEVKRELDTKLDSLQLETRQSAKPQVSIEPPSTTFESSTPSSQPSNSDEFYTITSDTNDTISKLSLP